jgi:hypothetical protein
METDAVDARKGDPMCVRDLDSYGVEIGWTMQARLDSDDHCDLRARPRETLPDQPMKVVSADCRHRCLVRIECGK